MTKLITTPLRITARTAQIALREAGHVSGRAVGAAARVVGVGGTAAAPPQQAPTAPRRAAGREQRSRARQTAGRRPPARERRPPAREGRAPARSRAAPPPPAEAPPTEPQTDRPPEAPAPRAEHVSEEATLVREDAEPGAEDGAGAQVTVAEPWEGYNDLNAQEVIGRLEGASSAELAAVELYEGGNRRRQTVLSAVERQLRRVSGRGSTN